MYIIQTSQSTVKNVRRQTWGGGQSMIPLHVDSPMLAKADNIEIPNMAAAQCDRGIHFLCSGEDEEWHDSFPSMPTEPKPTFKTPTKAPPNKRALLAVPSTSFKSPVLHVNCKFTQFHLNDHKSGSKYR